VKIKWFARLKQEFLKYKIFRAYSDAEMELKCKEIWNKILEEEKKGDLK